MDKEELMENLRKIFTGFSDCTAQCPGDYFPNQPRLGTKGTGKGCDLDVLCGDCWAKAVVEEVQHGADREGSS